MVSSVADPHPHRLEINENARINLGIKGWWGLISMVFGLGVIFSGFQWSMNGKITALYIENAHAHERIMTKLLEMDAARTGYVVKGQLENALIFIARRRDTMDGRPPMSPQGEFELRQQIRDFMASPLPYLPFDVSTNSHPRP